MEALSGIFAFLAGGPAIIGLVLTSLTIFLTSDWRLSLTALLVQCILVGLFLSRSISSEVAIVKILAGVLAVFILYLTARRIQEQTGTQPAKEGDSRFLGFSLAWRAGPLGLPLRLLAVVLLVLALVRLFGSYNFPLVSAGFAFAAFWMGGMGMLGLVLSGEPMRVAPAILTILAGFDLVYGGLESSLAIVGFWSAVTLLAALAFSYLAITRDLMESQDMPGKDEGEL
jgi:hypothetical protein